MEIGVCAWSFTGAHREAGLDLDPHTPEGLIRLAVQHGLKSIECSPGSFDGKSQEEIDAFKSQLAEHNLSIILDTGGAQFIEDISPLRDTLETAHRVGAPVIRTTLSGVVEGDRRRFGKEGWKQYLDALVKPLKEVMPLAAEYGIPIGIENHQDLCSWELVTLCEKVGSPMLGVTMDCGNSLAVGETMLRFADRIMPYLKHVHLKDYTVHPSESGYRLKRCGLGSGVVDWPALIAAFDQHAPQVRGCIELGASVARHIRLLEEDYWGTYDERPLGETLAALRTLHQAARPTTQDWRTPHERNENAAACAAYENEQFKASIAYLKGAKLI
jgi:sugar phosphate isomerase/epimerase